MLRSNRSFLRWLLLPAAVLTLAAQQPAPFDPDWVKPFPPFHILGNIYWVGTWDLATYLITTPQGHILINSGMKETVPQIVQGIEALGFKPTDVKLLLATHGHFDHVAGLAELKRITHAQIAMSKADAELVESGGAADFLFGKSPGALFDPAKVDRILAEGEKITLGGTELTMHLHPGHTKGAMSFTTTIQEGGKAYRVGIVNMGSINAGVTVTNMPGFPGMEEAYRKTFREQKALELDVFLASHAGQINLHRKYTPGDAYDPARFVDPAGYKNAVARMEASFLATVERERRKK
ncbi:MAG: subclass B3 metallo-beta-lactamase [Bryobacteraceae bacterium]